MGRGKEWLVYIIWDWEEGREEGVLTVIEEVGHSEHHCHSDDCD